MDEVVIRPTELVAPQQHDRRTRDMALTGERYVPPSAITHLHERRRIGEFISTAG
jgi:hypothetical protein